MVFFKNVGCFRGNSGSIHFTIAMKKILLPILLSIQQFDVYAQADSVRVIVYVADAFTGAVIEDGEADLLHSDSSFICSADWRYNTDNGKRTASLVLCRVPAAGSYILRLTHPNYFTLYYPVDIKAVKTGGFIRISEAIKMRKRPKTTNLNEVVIRATKIKMVMKDDTIVYDADAFQLSQGSMLDALIEQLPGAELKENGVITVNGKTISSLLVNGKDFFKGDPRIALENLPAYMVNKVKVYEQQTDFEKMTGFQESIRPLVMDVSLKRQYSIGWIANAEVAYGTKDKYLGRMFAMRFTDCSRFALFGNLNNTNDTRRPGQKGDWTPSYLPDGIRTSQSGGAEYLYENRLKTIEWTSNINVSHSSNHILTRSSGERYIPLDMAYTQSCSNEMFRVTSVSSKHNYKINKKARHAGSVLFNYDKNSYSSVSLAGEFVENPYSYVTNGVLDSLFLPDAGKLRQLARYRNSQEAYHRGENWSITATPYSLWYLPFASWGLRDMLTFDFAGSYDKHSSESFNKYRLEYFGDDALPVDYRNRYVAKPSQHYNYNTRITYFKPFGAFWPRLTYRYSHDYTSGRNDLYRLDRIDGWEEGTDHELGTLPSSSSEMQHALDIQNSEHSERWHRRHSVDLRMEYRIRKKHQTTIVANLPVRFELDRLLYDRNGVHYDLHRSKTMFTPGGYVQQVVFHSEKLKTLLNLNYSMSCEQPDLVNTIEMINNSNPLYVYEGNAGLRPTTSHKVSLEMHTSREFYKLYHFNVSYTNTSNAIAIDRTYNPTTGGYFVKPVNVDGNWRVDASLSLDRQFGGQRQFSWGNNTSFSYDHNVDMANVDGVTTNSLSIVRNMYIREQMTLNYSRNGWNIGAKVRGCYNRITGNRTDFTNINAWDYNYGISARIPLPWGVGLSTDFTVFSRRGYGNPSLNTDDLVWNMRLERSVLHGNLTFAIDGFDLLRELSKVTSIVNAQGRTESYTNVLPSYFMAHVIFRFNKQPKNKQ